MSVTFLSTKTIKPPTGEQAVRLPTIIHCYLLMHCLKDGPVAAEIMANVVANVANLMSKGTAPRMGKLATSARVLIISKLFCHSKVTAKMVQSPHQSKKSQPHRHSSMGSYSGQGKGGGNCQHQKKKTPKKLPKQKAYAVTFKNSVPSGVTTTSGGERENHGKVSSKMVLSGLKEGMYNRFSCFAVHSKMSQSTNAKSKPLEGLYNDTDPDDRSEIITDVTIRMPGKAGTMMMEVKVDPGAQPSCIPIA